jgi:two-component system, NarL family, nitrate/nitrite response regulator NarL
VIEETSLPDRRDGFEPAALTGAPGRSNALDCSSPVSRFHSTISTVLIDRDCLFARGFEVLLQQASAGGVRVMGHTASRSEALKLVRRHRPDVIVVGLSQPWSDGTTVVEDLKRIHPDRPLLVLTPKGDLDGPLASLRAKVDGVFDTTVTPETLFAAMQAITAGRRVIGLAVLEAMLEGAVRRPHERMRHMTSDDRQLWRLMSSGHSTEELSRILAVSQRTVKRRVASLLRRLRVRNRLQAAALAGRCGLLETGDE